MRCLRKDQIVKIINKKYKIKNKPVKSVHLMLNQLKMLGMVYIDGQFISVCGFKKGENFSDMITAVDIAVALIEGDMAEIHTGSGAVTLCFSVDVPSEADEPVKLEEKYGQTIPLEA